MQARNWTTQESRRTYVNGVLTNSVMANDTNYTFSFTGFNATNDFIHPTPGTYVKNWVGFCGGNTRNQVLNPPGSRTVTDIYGPQPGFTTGGHAPSMPSFSAQEWTNLRNRALEKLYDKMNHHAANVAVSVAEGHETRRMISGAIKSAGSVIAAARKTVRSIKHGEIVQVLSKAWLASQYGWRPLLQDVYGLLTFTTNRFVNGYTFKAGKKSFVETNNTLHPPTYPHISEIYTGKGFNAVYFSITATMSNQEAFDRAAITSLDPASIMWELVPYSFVVDWFYDVGGYLALQEAALGNGMQFAYGHETRLSYWKSKKVEVGAGITGNGTAVSPLRLTSSDLSSRRTQVSKSRIALTGFPRPRSPTLKVDLGASRVLSAGALLATLLAPSKRR